MPACRDACSDSGSEGESPELAQLSLQERIALAEQAAREECRGPYVCVLDGFLTPPECAGLVRFATALGWEACTVNNMGTQVVNLKVRNNGRCMLESPLLAERLLCRLLPYVPHEFEADSADGPPGTTWAVDSLNPRFKFLRYARGEYFLPHVDARVDVTREQLTRGVREELPGDGGAPARRDPGDQLRSCVTVLLYLADVHDAAGGKTRFFLGGGPPFPREVGSLAALRRAEPTAGAPTGGFDEVACAAGRLLLFEQGDACEHEGGRLADSPAEGVRVAPDDDPELNVKYCIRTDVMYRLRRPDGADAGTVEAAGSGETAAPWRTPRAWRDVLLHATFDRECPLLGQTREVQGCRVKTVAAWQGWEG